MFNHSIHHDSDVCDMWCNEGQIKKKKKETLEIIDTFSKRKSSKLQNINKTAGAKFPTFSQLQVDCMGCHISTWLITNFQFNWRECSLLWYKTNWPDFPTVFALTDHKMTPWNVQNSSANMSSKWVVSLQNFKHFMVSFSGRAKIIWKCYLWTQFFFKNGEKKLRFQTKKDTCERALMWIASLTLCVFQWGARSINLTSLQIGNKIMPRFVSVLRNHRSLSTSKPYISVVFLNPFLHWSPCFSLFYLWRKETFDISTCS